VETGSVLRKKGSGNRALAPDSFEAILQDFQRSSRKSIRSANLELRIPRSTVHDVEHKRLRLRAYKIQLVQKLRENDKPVNHTFALEMLSRLDVDDAFMKHNMPGYRDSLTFGCPQ
jgi:hypothetical protein